MQESILSTIREKLDCETVANVAHLPGGFSHQHYLIETDKGKHFLKVGPLSWLSNFEAEVKCLHCIDNTATLRVPIPQFYGANDTYSYLILEYIPLSNHTDESQKKLGMQVAKMHLTKNPFMFGFDCDNAIGVNKQINHWTKSWVEFFRDYRLKTQFKLVDETYQDSELVNLAEQLYGIFPDFFKGIQIIPSLLHGDLWYGNTGMDDHGSPVVYDPACYYGHHEAELGIMKIFGGFSSDFFDAYHACIPQEKGAAEREKCYQLYHYLNHYNTFGESYRGDCLEILKDLLS